MLVCYFILSVWEFHQAWGYEWNWRDSCKHQDEALLGWMANTQRVWAIHSLNSSDTKLNVEEDITRTKAQAIRERERVKSLSKKDSEPKMKANVL